MKQIKDLVRENIRNLKPYSSARDEYKGKEGIFLDANENPYGELNRYPDPLQTELKQAISNLKNIPAENIFIGNGSDEIIDLTFRIFCRPGIDKAVTLAPSYGMYDVAASINDIGLVKVALEKDFSIDPGRLRDALLQEDIKLFILCSPNNPTGNAFPKEALIQLLKEFKGIILVDEAYIDFSTSSSWMDEIEELRNLIVCQTFSKSSGLAAARVGIACSSDEIIKIYTSVKPPYNVSTLNQQAAIEALKNRDKTIRNIRQIISSREGLAASLAELDTVSKIYPSDANFLLVEFTDGPATFSELVKRKIITRNRNNIVRNCIRITVGTEEENHILIKELKAIGK
ncbi:MAG: histidinol-phosphate transaminase [Marinilabiliaceae bacterium]|jgi:histidinol-phosphate aminotransferase|nr:histidinol-phosphate transaminase [Marinilabiliaceae bacterium]